MKVLIIEDNDYKLEVATRILNKFGITNITHVSYFSKARYLMSSTEFDLIILDLCFYQYNLSKCFNANLNQNAGYAFLAYMDIYDNIKDVIIFSSEPDYFESLRDFLNPSLNDFKRYLRLKASKGNNRFNTFSPYEYLPPISHESFSFIDIDKVYEDFKKQGRIILKNDTTFFNIYFSHLP